jgi:hypothetical protein
LVSALDHLAYQLVCKDTGNRPPAPHRIYFPVADDRRTYDSEKTGQLTGARTETVAAIDELKPYRGGDDALWALHRLNRVEKHRLLLTVGSQAGGVHLGQLLATHLPEGFPAEATTMLKEMTHYLMPADKGFPLAPGFELYIGGPDEPINPSLQFRFEVVLDEPDIIVGKSISDTIKEMCTRVEFVTAELSPLLR